MGDRQQSTVATVHTPNISDFWRTSGFSVELLGSISKWVFPVAFLLFAAVAPMCVLFLKKKLLTKMKKPIKKVSAGDFGSREDLTQKYIDDYQFSMDLQIQEVLLASLSSSQVTNTASSSTQTRRRLNTDSSLVMIETELASSSQVSCEICLEDKRSWEMFRKNCCHSSFCGECISKHIVAKVQENAGVIRCPGAECKATLDFNTCRLMIPRDVLAKWDEFLCQSVIPNSQKLFCPFRDCSAMLIDDSEEVIREIKCPLCHRPICAVCRVPWHSDFTCKEFQKLNAKKGGKDEKMLKFLAKKKSWQKCPSCKIHVEKTEGCLHMTCRCRHEFCYKCGSKWSDSHRCKKS